MLSAFSGSIDVSQTIRLPFHNFEKLVNVYLETHKTPSIQLVIPLMTAHLKCSNFVEKKCLRHKQYFLTFNKMILYICFNLNKCNLIKLAV